MTYEHVSLSDVEARNVDGIEPALRAVGYQLQPEEMRPSVWDFAAGESNNRHRQQEQEELYVVLDGSLEMEVDGETFTISDGEYVVVSPDSWRQLTALEASRVLAIGAPNVADDAIDENE